MSDLGTVYSQHLDFFLCRYFPLWMPVCVPPFSEAVVWGLRTICNATGPEMPTCLVECKESPTVYRYSTRNRLFRTQSYANTLSRSEGLVQQGIFYFLRKSQKLASHCIGLFKIFWNINQISYWLLQPKSMCIPPISHIMSLFPLSPIPTPCARHHQQSHGSLASGHPPALWKSQASSTAATQTMVRTSGAIPSRGAAVRLLPELTFPATRKHFDLGLF